MNVTIHIDGGSRGNPGPAGAGVVLVNTNDQSAIHEAGYFLGKMTNNMAEYNGLIRALQVARDLKIEQASIYSDSELMVKQILGEYRVKSEDLQPLFEKAQFLLLGINQWKIQHIRREKNQRADQLANMAMDAEDDCIVVDGSKGEVDHIPSANPSPTDGGRPKPKAASKKNAANGGELFTCTIESNEGSACSHDCVMDEPLPFGPTVPDGFCVYAARAALMATPLDKPDRMRNLRRIEATCPHCECRLQIELTR